MGSTYSTFACYIVMVVLSLYSLFKVLKPEFTGSQRFKAAYRLNTLYCRSVGGKRSAGACYLGKLAVVIAIAAAVIVYLLALLWIKAIKREDVLMLPKDKKLLKCHDKYDWIG